MTLFAEVNTESGRDLRESSCRFHARCHLLGRPKRAGKRGRLLRGRTAESPGARNGLAISGDYLSAASFLGIRRPDSYLYGFDGFLYSIGFLVAFLTVMFLLAERIAQCR